MFSKLTNPKYLLPQYQEDKAGETLEVKFKWAYFKWKPLYIFFFLRQKGVFPAPAG